MKTHITGLQPPTDRSCGICTTTSQEATTFRLTNSYAEDADAPATRKAYTADLECFVRHHGTPPTRDTTTEDVAAYVAHLADSGYKPATVRRRIAAISRYLKARGLEPVASLRREPLRSVWRGYLRRLALTGDREQERAAPITADVLRQLVQATGAGRSAIRDRALLLLGFAGALRRSELARVRLRHLTATDAGLELLIPRSKTDQTGRGHILGIPYATTTHRGADGCTDSEDEPPVCPVLAVQDLIDMLTEALDNVSPDTYLFTAINRWGGVSDQPLSGRSISRIIKRHAAAAGLDEGQFSGHSLRAGLITEAVRRGKPEAHVMRHSRHRSVEVFRTYVRPATVWQDNAADGLL